jgi:hypothetical protein
MIVRLPLFTKDVSVDMFLLLCFSLTGTWKSPDASSTHCSDLTSYRISYIYIFRLKREHGSGRKSATISYYDIIMTDHGCLVKPKVLLQGREYKQTVYL